MTQRKDQKGCVFDIPESNYKRFRDNFSSLKRSQGQQLGFTIEKCSTLPDLMGGSDAHCTEERSSHPSNGQC